MMHTTFAPTVGTIRATALAGAVLVGASIASVIGDSPSKCSWD